MTVNHTCLYSGRIVAISDVIYNNTTRRHRQHPQNKGADKMTKNICTLPSQMPKRNLYLYKGGVTRGRTHKNTLVHIQTF